MRYFVLAMFLIGCGDGSGSGSGSGSVNNPKVLAETTVDVTAHLVAPDDTYPVCDSDNEGKLIFVLDDDAFYYCDQDLSWVLISLKGKNGVDGKPGKDGANGQNGNAGKDGKDGRDGRDGANGQNGRDGRDGTDGQVVSTSEWVHPITGATYFLTTGRYIDFRVDYDSACPEGSVQPDPSEPEHLLPAYPYFGEFAFNAFESSGQDRWSIVRAGGVGHINADYPQNQYKFICMIEE